MLYRAVLNAPTPNGATGTILVRKPVPVPVPVDINNYSVNAGTVRRRRGGGA
jgi:hypothetical protein